MELSSQVLVLNDEEEGDTLGYIAIGSLYKIKLNLQILHLSTQIDLVDAISLHRYGEHARIKSDMITQIDLIDHMELRYNLERQISAIVC